MTSRPTRTGAPSAVRQPSRPARRVVLVLLWLLVVPVVAVVVARALPDDAVLPVPQLAGMTPWAGLLALLVLLGALAVRRARVLAVLAGASLAACAVWVAPFFTAGDGAVSPAAADPAEPRALRVMTVNAFLGQADADAVVALVREQQVEVLAVVELTTGFREELADAGLDDVLPWSVQQKMGERASRGSGLWSATPLADVDAGDGTTFAMPSGVVDVGGTPVRVHAVHPVPPVPRGTRDWHRELDVLHDRVHADPTAQVLVGDFNATADHVSFRRLLGDRFQDAAQEWGRGLDLTWPVGRGVPALLALDHVVTERTAGVSDVVVRDVPGSDHRAVAATVVVP